MIHYRDIAINDEDDGLLALEDKSFADVFEPKPSSEVQMGELLPIIKADTTMYVTFIYSSVSLRLLIYIYIYLSVLPDVCEVTEPGLLDQYLLEKNFYNDLPNLPYVVYPLFFFIV